MEEYRTKAEAQKALQAKIKRGLKGWKVRKMVTYIVVHRLFG